MIIVEGPDLVGKTSVCQKLVKRLQSRGVIYAHFSRLPLSFDRYWGYQRRASRNIIQDRFHMSEPIYAAMRKDYTALDPEKYRMVDGMLRQLGAVHVVITATNDLIKSRWGREEMYDIEQVFEVNSMFKLMANQQFKGYEPDVDFHFECSPHWPFVPEDSLSQIEDLWIKRQDTLGEIIDARPGAL